MLSLVQDQRAYHSGREMKAVAGNLYVTTDDGSYGSKGVWLQMRFRSL